MKPACSRKATLVEIDFFKEVKTIKSEKTSKIQSTFQSLVSEYIEAGMFNKIISAGKTDAELKAKYDSMLLELK